MKVFHGSYTKIKEIDLTKSLPNKDFGQGFYVTNTGNMQKIGQQNENLHHIRYSSFTTRPPLI
ncbi:MAG: DUF3990 domain-containing protein [Bacteroidales bacterium]|jgi:hypothetical protein|nr:DUF3990 domain-containing protein [Bacteroidales bacterium]